MRSIISSIKSCIYFYLFLFAVQLAFFFIIPPYYVVSPHHTHIPSFIKWSFAKYFGLIILLYITWGVLLGAFNGIILKSWGSQFRYGKFFSLPSFSLLATQLLSLFLLISFLFPSLLGNYLGLDHLPLACTYALLLALILGSGYLALISSDPKPLRRLLPFILAVGLPLFAFYLLSLPTSLNLPRASSRAQATHPDVLLLGFDALNGDSGNSIIKNAMSNHAGRLYINAFTPLPLTHPAWHSILSGLYPKNHRVRFFFDSPLPPLYPQLYVPLRLKNEAHYSTLFAADQPETSFFTVEQGFDQTVLLDIGWKAHLSSMMMNHFVFPAIWLNNSLVEKFLHRSINSPGIFNYDLARFYNQSFHQLAELSVGPKFLALHSCYLHSPIHLNRSELASLPNYLFLSPREFTFWKWPDPGEARSTTSPGWRNPYYVRREKTLAFMGRLLEELQIKGYFDNDLVFMFSDHGERFSKNYEIYGGIHGLDLQTREQNNVVFAIFDPRLKDFKIEHGLVSLIDIAPTVLALVGMQREGMPYDGLALLDEGAQDSPLPQREIWAESMGFIDDKTEQDRFPQLSIHTLEESLVYEPDGRVRIDTDYYNRILQKKEFADLSKIPEMLDVASVMNATHSSAGDSF
jgi:sulfatase-like protein